MHIDNQNIMNISTIVDKEFACDCGKNHKITTQSIVVGNDIMDKFFDSLNCVVPSGSKLFVITDNTVFDMYANHIIRLLERKGYRVVKAVFEDNWVPVIPFSIKMPEDINLVLSIGGGTIVDIAKYLAHQKKIPIYAYVTSIYAKNVLAPSVFVSKNGFYELVKTKPPIGVCVDIKTLVKYDAYATCHSVISYCANCIAVFDWYFLSVVGQASYCKNIANQVLESAILLVKELTRYLQGEINLLTLQQAIVERNLRLSALCQCIGDSRIVCGSSTIVAQACKMHKKECAFFVAEIDASSRLNDIYTESIFHIGKPQKEFIAPPDNHKRSELISETFNVDIVYNYTKITPYYTKSHIDSVFRKIDSHKSILLDILRTQKVLLNSVIAFINKSKISKHNSVNNEENNKRIQSVVLDKIIALSPDIHLKPTALTVLKQLSLLERYL